MKSEIWVNLPTKDLNKSVAFFSKLGFSFDARYTNDNAACLVIDETIFVMLVIEPIFKSFTKKEIVDTHKGSEVILALSAPARENVDEIIHKVIDAGGSTPNEKQDHGWMYSQGFQDPDGHLWEVFWMDPAGAPKE